MRIAVVGAGAVGGTLAALLANAGHDVHVTARGEHLAAIQDRGLHLTGAWGSVVALVGASEVLDDDLTPELAFVTVKASGAVSAMRDSAAALDGVPVVVVQNGLGALSSAASALPRSPAVGALAMFAASFLSPGDVSVTTPGSICLGGADVAALGIAQRVLSPVIPVAVTPDFLGAQWTKLIVNQVNALPAITGLSVQQVIADRDLRAVLTASMREAVSVALVLGIRFQSLQGLSDRMLRTFAAVPPVLAELLPRTIARRMGDVPNPGSTLQSIRRGQPTEVDALNGAIVAEAALVGVDTPVNAELVGLVHEVEASTGEAGSGFVPPAEVVARIWLACGR
ncbi:MAG: 2-dehydropantoate 2-reductase [Burkholderiaceae bacterium]|nr:2-dehydropantoate 2-reductase [Microbacteriaceae bacterium]